MDIEAVQKAQVLSIVTEDVPQGFWAELESTAKSLYSGAFQEVSEDDSLLDSQKLSFLWQLRHYRMEALISQIAESHNVPVSEEKIQANRCAYAYLCPGRVAMTQHYVRETGKLPRPSEFRKLHAAMNDFSRMPQLELGDKIIDVFAPKSVNGITVHSPVGCTFDKDSQRLGALGFYVPHHDYSGWIVNLSLTEILAAYEPIQKREDRALPKWKIGQEEIGKDNK